MPPPSTKQAVLIEAIFSRPALFYYLRRPIYWGTFARLQSALALADGERLLDVGCGTGMCARLAKSAYVGMDTALPYLRFANARWRSAVHSFVAMDAFACGFAADAFDKAILINMVHHLDDIAVDALFAQLRSIVRTRVVVMDAAPEIASPLERWVLHYDRGHHIRSGARLRTLFSTHFEIEREERFHNALRIVPQVVFSLRPRR
jgi:SAM-dependent methyltransferase